MAQQAQVYNPFEVIHSKLDYFEKILKEHTQKEPEPQSENPSGDIFIPKEKVADIYDVSHVTVWQWEKKGILQSYRIGNLKRFKLSEVMAAPVPIKRATRSE